MPKTQIVLISILTIIVLGLIALKFIFLPPKPGSSLPPTPPPTLTPLPPILNQHDKDQLQDDYIFGQAYDQFHRDYPWYSQIPIITDQFTIIYDFNRQAFRIRNTSSLPNNTILPAVKIKLEALNATQSANYYFINP